MNFRLALPLSIALLLTACEKKPADQTEIVPASPETPQSADGSKKIAAPGKTAAEDSALLSPTFDPVFMAEEKAKFEAWCAKYRFDPKDDLALREDADADGFSNMEEYEKGTDPRDPNSIPGLVPGVALKEFVDVKVPMVLRDVKDGVARIERTDLAQEEQLKEGVQPKGTAYRVKAVKHEVKADKEGIFTDMSSVTLENPDTRETVFLVKDLPARSTASRAILVNADGSEQTIRVGEVITLASQPGRKFHVLDLRNDQVVVQEVGGAQVYTIPKK